MFCPNCAAQNNTDQKFCRSCGMNLEETALSVLEQYPSGRRLDLQKEERLLEKFGNIAFTGFGIVIGIGVLGIIYAIVTKMILSGTQPMAGILLVAFVVFAALSLGYIFWREALDEEKQKVGTAPDLQMVNDPPAGKLLNESTFEPVRSVTEDTTELLGVKRNTKKLN